MVSGGASLRARVIRPVIICIMAATAAVVLFLSFASDDQIASIRRLMIVEGDGYWIIDPALAPDDDAERPAYWSIGGLHFQNYVGEKMILGSGR